MGSLTSSPAGEPPLSQLQGPEVTPDKHTTLECFFWSFLAISASFPHCERYMRKILPLGYFHDIKIQRKGDSGANNHGFMLWLSLEV